MSSDFIWRFTPSRTDPQLLQEIFVQREPLLKDVIEKVEESANTGNKHHLMLIGPRGIGKTHFVSLLHHRIAQDHSLSNKLRVAWLHEDETTTSFVQLLLRIYRALSIDYPEEFPVDTVAQLLEKPPVDIERELKTLLVAAFREKTLLIIVENLDFLFEGLGAVGQSEWRAFLQEHPITTVIATSQRLFKGIQKRTEPFFGFFNPIHLEPLEVKDAVLLLRQIALHNEQQELVDYLKTGEGKSRIRALHHLAGGNHRIYIVLSGFITRDSLEELVQPFEKMADELTPYYQERMRWLSPQQRRIVEFLCTRTSPETPKKLAKHLLASENTISSQLVKLSELGYVVSERRGRESLYELAEPLMRLASEVKQRGTLSLLVDFLRVWYCPEALQEMHDAACDESLKKHLLAAISAHKNAIDSSFTTIQWDGTQGVAPSEEDSNNMQGQFHVVSESMELIKLASSELNANRLDEAMECIDKALLLSPNFIYAWFWKANALIKMERNQDAIECLDYALNIEPTFAVALIWKGIALQNLERHEEALYYFDKAIPLDPDYAFAWSKKSNAYESLGKYNKAIKCLDQAIILEPENAYHWSRKASIYEDLHQYDDALQCLDRALTLEPEDDYAWYLKGTVLNRLKLFDEALNCFNRAIEIAPEDLSNWASKGILLLRIMRFEESIECLDKALAIKPQDVYLWNCKGISLYNLKRYEEALACYQTSLKLDSNDAFAKIRICKPLFRLRRWEEGFESLRSGMNKTNVEEIDDLASMVGVLHVESDTLEELQSHVDELVMVFEDSNQLTSLGNGLVLSLKYIDSNAATSKKMKSWQDTWNIARNGRSNLEVPVRIYNVGIEYLITKDERIFLNLVQPERLVLKQALGLEEMPVDN